MQLDPRNRREFVTLLGGAAAAWPLAARAQQPAMPVVGVISAGSRQGYEDLLAKFRAGLREFGYVEGQNVAIEYRFAAGKFDQLPQLAEDLAQRGVAVMVSTGTKSSLAARGASSTIPHVFLSQDDPIKLGFVASFNRPGGRATGVSLQTAELMAKQVELTRLLTPGAPLYYLMNSTSLSGPQYLQDIESVARALKQPLVILKVSSPEEIDVAFADLARQKPGSVIVSSDSYRSAGATRSSHSPRVTRCRRSTTGATIQLLAAS